jgi:hypothetical protein
MIGRLTKTGRCYGMKMNVTRISRQTFPLQTVIDQKWPENVEHFNYLGSMIANGARYTREIKCSIVTVKEAFNKKKTLLTSKLELNLRKNLVNCYIRSIALLWR